MKKSLIALAVAGVFVAPAAMADVTIYGQANASFDRVSEGNATGSVNGTTNSQVSSNASRIGFKGSEDLGGGTSAIWQIESGVNLDNSLNAGATSSFANRDSFVGLSSESMGTVLLGTHDTPYKMASRGLDLFADTIADNRSLMGGGSFNTAAAIAAATLTTAIAAGGVGAGASFDGRQGNVLAYVSPSMSGFTAAIGYVPLSETASGSGALKSSAWSLAGLYGAGPITANLAYETHDIDSLVGVSGVKESAYKLGLGYAMDAFAVNFVYEHTKDNIGKAFALADENTFGHNAYYLGGKFNVSASDAVKLAYARAGDRHMNGAGSNTSANQVSLGYDHAMSKRTTVYALYTRLSNSSASGYALMNGGTTGGMSSIGLDADPSAWSIGIKHSF